MSTLYLLLIANGCGYLLYTNVAVLVPMFVLNNHPIFSSVAVGVLIASYQLSYISIAPFIGSNLASFGRRRAMKFAIYIVSAATAVFAIAGWF